MKKTLMIALAGMMLFAFTQCGGGGKDGNKTEATEVTKTSVKGSKEYRESMEALNKMNDLLNDIKTCEDYDDFRPKWEAISDEMDKKVDAYTEDEKMTKEEKEDFLEHALEFLERCDEVKKAVCN